MSLNLPRYRCHKIVGAAPIDYVHVWDAQNHERPPYSDVFLLDGTGVKVPAAAFSRGSPERGDYLVEYEDGYLSWSPKKAFEEGYSPLAPPPQQAYADRLSQPRDETPTTDGPR